MQGEKRKHEEEGDDTPFPSKRPAPEVDVKLEVKQEIKEESKVLVEAYSSDEEEYQQQSSSAATVDERSRNCPYLDTINRYYLYTFMSTQNYDMRKLGTCFSPTREGEGREN